MLAEVYAGRRLQRVDKAGGAGALEDMVGNEAVRAVEHVLVVHMRLMLLCAWRCASDESIGANYSKADESSVDAEERVELTVCMHL